MRLWKRRLEARRTGGPSSFAFLRSRFRLPGLRVLGGRLGIARRVVFRPRFRRRRGRLQTRDGSSRGAEFPRRHSRLRRGFLRESTQWKGYAIFSSNAHDRVKSENEISRTLRFDSLLENLSERAPVARTPSS